MLKLNVLFLLSNRSSHMSQFMGDREGGGKTVVLDDGTALRRLAHRTQLRESQSVTFPRSPESSHEWVSLCILWGRAWYEGLR